MASGGDALELRLSYREPYSFETQLEFLALRAIPGITVIRPADMSETVEAWRLAMQMATPVALILSRQKLPVLQEGTHGHTADLAKGAYVVADTAGQPDMVMIATG